MLWSWSCSGPVTPGFGRSRNQCDNKKKRAQISASTGATSATNFTPARLGLCFTPDCDELSQIGGVFKAESCCCCVRNCRVQLFKLPQMVIFVIRVVFQNILVQPMSQEKVFQPKFMCKWFCPSRHDTD